jgi:2-polyprenyl-6-methoxyphenol hydroxylase-like FAD-dependent oxidoreductase
VVEADVLIAGGGVAGLATSLGLARVGLSCLVLEAARRRGELDRGDVLHAYALEILEEWDAASDIFHAGALRISGFRVMDNKGAVLKNLDTRRDVSPPADLVALRHSSIENSLEAAAIRTGKVQIVYGVRCLALLKEEGRVVGVKTTKGDYRASLTVAATGSSSRLVADDFPTAFKVKYNASYYSMRCGFVSFHRDAGVYALGPRGVLVTAPLPNHETRVVLQLSRLQAVPTGNDLDEQVRSLGLAFDGSLPVLQAHLYRVACYMARRFWRPGVVLVGDTAHTTHPVGGQGMNLAIRGAHSLAASIKRIGDLSSIGVDRSCAEYQHDMRRRAFRTLWLTHVLGAIGASRRLRHLGCSVFSNLSDRRIAALLSRLCWGA